MSQPPSPYSRSYSFTGWKVSNPNDPLPGNNVDQQLDNIGTSLNATISRLNEIQRDDGKIKDSALPGVLANANDYVNAAAHDAAVAAAAEASALMTNNFNASNLSFLTDKSAARANLQLSQYYQLLDGSNLIIHSDPNNQPVFPALNPAINHQPGQGIDDWVGPGPSFPGKLSTSTYESRKLRASILFGTLFDYPTHTFREYTTYSNGVSTVHNVPAPDITERIDNISFALLGAGLLPRHGTFGNTGGGEDDFDNLFNTTYDPYQHTFRGYWLGYLPHQGNPLITIRQLKSAIDRHKADYNHTNIPTTTQKGAIDQANNASSTNPFATLADVQSHGNINANQLAAIANSNYPSIENPFITYNDIAGGLPDYIQNATFINNASGYVSAGFSSTYYPKEMRFTLNGTTYAIPARIVT